MPEAERTTSGTASQTPQAEEIMDCLRRLSPGLAVSYKQVLSDLGDQTRSSFKGTANEMREILRVVLELLAPDDKVRQCAWFIEKRKQAAGRQEERKPPERAERIRFILESRTNEATRVGTAQKAVEQIERHFEYLALPLYSDASNAAHRGTAREDLIQILRYMNAVLLDLLPKAG